MNGPQRHYFIFQLPESLKCLTVLDSISVDVFHVPMRGWKRSEWNGPPWTVRNTALQIAHGLLCHHYGLLFDAKLASHLATLWREGFAYEVLMPCKQETLHLTDTFISRWALISCVKHAAVYYDQLPLEGTDGHTQP